MPEPHKPTADDLENMRDQCRNARAALVCAESSAYCASPLFSMGGMWNESPYGAALLGAIDTLTAIIGDGDTYRETQPKAAKEINYAQGAYTLDAFAAAVRRHRVKTADADGIVRVSAS